MKLLLQHNTVFKNGDLAETFLLGFCLFSAGNLDHKLQKSLRSIINGLAVSDRTGIEVDPAFLSLRKLAVCRQL